MAILVAIWVAVYVCTVYSIIIRVLGETYKSTKLFHATYCIVQDDA
jgi:hypothetical protein